MDYFGSESVNIYHYHVTVLLDPEFISTFAMKKFHGLDRFWSAPVIYLRIRAAHVIEAAIFPSSCETCLLTSVLLPFYHSFIGEPSLGLMY